MRGSQVPLVVAVVTMAWIAASPLRAAVTTDSSRLAPAGTLDELLGPQIERLAQPRPAPPADRPDPFRITGTLMQDVGASLGRHGTGDAVRRKQRQIISVLDKVIEELEKECSSCQSCGGSGSGGGRPLADSVLMGGPGGVGEMRDGAGGRREWLKLPPHQREKIVQSRNEGFPPGYEAVLEEYYRRLAEDPSRPGADREPVRP